MTYVAIALASQLLAADRQLIAAAELPSEPSVYVERDPEGPTGTTSLSVWMPIVAEGARTLTHGELRKIARDVRSAADEKPLFVVDELQAGQRRSDGGDGGVAGAIATPGFNLVVSTFASSSIPPDLQQQLFDAVAEVESYLESQIHNAVIGQDGEPQDVTLRLSLRVQALAAGVPGASQVRTSAVNMSEVTRKLNDDVTGSDGDDAVSGLPNYLDENGDAAGVASLRVRYSNVSTAVSGENRVFLTRAQYNALGFGVFSPPPSSLQFDGTVLMNSGFQWDFDPTDGVSLNQVTRFSFQDYLIREILIQLGWISGIDFLQRDLTLLDMFRFSSVAPADPLVGITGESPFTGEAINTLLGSAGVSNTILQGIYGSGGGLPSQVLPLDYNPGVDAALIDVAQAIVADGAAVDADHLANMISTGVAAPPVTGTAPLPEEARMLTLMDQLMGLETPVPLPNDPARPTALDRENRFDDAEWPAEPAGTRTAFPDGALPRYVGWPSAPRVRWDFNAPVTLAAAGSTDIVAPSVVFAGARLELIGGLTVANCAVDPGAAPARLLATPGGFARSSDTAPVVDFVGDTENRVLRIESGWAADAGIEVRCSTAGATAVTVFFDMSLDEAASSTWEFSYSTNGGATYGTDGLPNDGLITVTTAGYQCGIQFDLLIDPTSFTPGANTRFRMKAVVPDGALGLQSVSEAAGGAVPFSADAPVEFDMITVSPDVGAQLLVDYSPGFRGHMPRVVARGARSHLNFGLAPEFFRSVEDTELAMGTGNSYTTSRASFLTQTTVTIPPYERFLMGQTSTSSSTTIPRGITYWTRDPLAYASGPGSPGWTFLGAQPDFLSLQELLVLDSIGWDVTGFSTFGFSPDPVTDPWIDYVGEQLHTPHEGFDDTGSARP